jgi:hypothetical protein
LQLFCLVFSLYLYSGYIAVPKELDQGLVAT